MLDYSNPLANHAGVISRLQTINRLVGQTQVFNGVGFAVGVIIILEELSGHSRNGDTLDAVLYVIVADENGAIIGGASHLSEAGWNEFVGKFIVKGSEDMFHEKSHFARTDYAENCCCDTVTRIAPIESTLMAVEMRNGCVSRKLFCEFGVIFVKAWRC